MALFASGGKLLTAGQGRLASSSGCCCQPEDDPDRIVKCCFNGACAEITADECAFLRGAEVADCEDCITPPPDTNSTNCNTCCNSNEVEELDAIFSMYVSDPLCVGLFGQGCNTTRSYGRLGESLIAQAQITLQRTIAGGCEYTFDACVPLGAYGNITNLRVTVTFSLKRKDGRSIFFPGFFGCGSTQKECECVFSLNKCFVQLHTCGFPNNQDLAACTTPGSGGVCSQTIFPNSENDYQSAATGTCSGSAIASREEILTWQDLNFGCFTNIVGLLVTGSPKRRDVGNVVCGTIDNIPTGELTHTIRSRVAITIL